MKKILLILFVCVSTISYAQDFKYGLVGGYNHSAPSAHEGKPGFHIGVKGELGLIKQSGLYLDFELLYSSQNWQSGTYYDSDNKTSTNFKYSPAYLQIPVRLGYRFSLGDNVKLLINAGPYASIGLHGKSKVTSSVENVENINKSDVFNNTGLERFDMGIGARVGVELYNHFQLIGGYDCGFINTDSNINLKNKNRGWALSVAYMF